jgi:hypothetical protein
VIFALAAKIGFLALAIFIVLLIASIFANTPRILWLIGFLAALFALCAQLAGWLVLSYRSAGYGMGGTFLYWEYWLLVLASGVSASFAFSGWLRYLALCLLAGGIWLSTQFFGLLWMVPYRSAVRLLGVDNEKRLS